MARKGSTCSTRVHLDPERQIMPLLDLKSAAHFWLGRSLPLPPAGPPIDHVDGWHVARAIAIKPDHHQKKKRIHTGSASHFDRHVGFLQARASRIRLPDARRHGIKRRRRISLPSPRAEQPAAQSPDSASPVLSPSFLIHISTPLVCMASLCFAADTFI